MLRAREDFLKIVVGKVRGIAAEERNALGLLSVESRAALLRSSYDVGFKDCERRRKVDARISR